ncbi:copper chaperone PCu(A)C [Glaciecola sp. XM2]|jgi:copper(I)-binding protein|uniref:copper chaperone PCu(A)C n=1 Tax=Glaciecola sp. XM2 TaxID=1914931 RepID=UPI001BDDCF63|nr:copper chaperone PCu(A)C [Glaciecola sp. XM2]MBT1452223.1 copper chaperone PCu(A)C [Glaciecola sp. XM2]
MNKVIWAGYIFLVMMGAHIAHAKANDADATMAQNIVVDKVWARETFKMARSGAAYAQLTNPSDAEIVLVGASVDESIASMVELHETNMVNGMMRMQELEQGIAIAPGASVSMQPGGMHFMIMGLQGPLVAGESFTLTLEFADQSQQTLNVGIQDMSNRKADDASKPKTHN